MNIEFHARQYRTEAEQRAAAIERRTRFYALRKIQDMKDRGEID